VLRIIFDQENSHAEFGRRLLICIHIHYGLASSTIH
jgi:hypothetical protein